MTKEQIIAKLSASCARAEHCLDDMRRKMERWQVEKNVQEEVLQYLVKEKYIDESRYARFFINVRLSEKNVLAKLMGIQLQKMCNIYITIKNHFSCFYV